MGAAESDALGQMRGRRMAGWLRVDPLDDVEIETWVCRGTAYAGSLPPKKR